MKTSLRKYLSLVMVLCVAFVCLFAGVRVKAASTVIDLTDQGYANAQEVTSVTSGDITLTFSKGTGSTTPKYYTSGTSVRLYAKGTLTVSAGGQIIEKIKLTFGSSDKANAITANVGTFTTDTWTGSASSVVLSVGGTKDHRRIKTVEVTVASSNPSISLDGEANVQVGVKEVYSAAIKNTTGTIVWSVDDDAVATVDQNGVLTPVSTGFVTVTAALASDESVYDEIEVVVWPNNSQTISIATAKEICDFTGANNSAFQYSIVGTIETIDYAYNSTNNNISVTLSDGTDTISLYKMTGGDDLSVGSKIKVTGYLCLYNSTTYEVNEGSTYEIVIDESLTTLIAALNNVQAYLSLGYKYVVTEEKVYYTVDTLNNATTEVSGTSYTEWTGKTANSNAVYAGQSAGGTAQTGAVIQLRSNNSNSGIVSTTSGGLVTKVTVTWNANTAAERILDIYGSNTAYTSPTELYGSSLVGEKIGSIAYGETTFVISGEYAYIGVRSNSGALYLDSIEFTWVDDSYEDSTSINSYTDVDFRIRVGVDSAIANLEDADSWGIKVTSSNGTVKEYLADSDYIFTEGDFIFAIISLGDVLNNSERLTVEFTVEAYVVVDGVNYYSNQSKTYSVAGMVQKYYEEDGNTAVESLYNELVSMDKIAK